MIEPIADPLVGRDIPDTVVIETPRDEDYRIPAPIGDGRIIVNAMELLPTRMTDLIQLEVTVTDGAIRPQDLPDGVCMATVVPRHGQATRPVSAPLNGLGITSGAIAHTVGHDCHNIMVAGRSDSDMRIAVETLKKIGGGFALVDGGEVIATVPLPFAGLMAFESCETLSGQIEAYNVEVRKRGVMPESTRPIMALTGLPLAVIPAIRITDLHPLLDVVTQEPIPLFAEAEARA